MSSDDASNFLMSLNFRRYSFSINDAHKGIRVTPNENCEIVLLEGPNGEAIDSKPKRTLRFRLKAYAVYLVAGMPFCNVVRNVGL